ADWIVDIGPGAGQNGGTLLYSGEVAALKKCKESITRTFLFNERTSAATKERKPLDWLKVSNINRNNLKDLSVEFPLSCLTAITGVSGSGKTTLLNQVLAESIQAQLGSESEAEEDSDGTEVLELDIDSPATLEGAEKIRRLVCVDQKPIGRTPRSNLATYTGLFDVIRQRFAQTDEAKARSYNAGRFSFNVNGGRCASCEGEGFVAVELMFLPSVYTPCSSCRGQRYNDETLEVKYRGMNIAEVLSMTVDEAAEFFTELPSVARGLKTLKDVGLGYLRIGQAATELSGGEAQRIKLSNELQRVQKGDTLYLLDEPSSGLHPADVERLMKQLHQLVDAGNTVILIEHDMDVVSQADWVIDLGPGAGAAGGQVVAEGPPAKIAKSKRSKTAAYLSQVLAN
ncbi:MAG: ATP-binding cassette domain-containing protein, partial [Candidatus Obscuribacterales bacterium]|nr:ATP-binding cassette domain-containing protein [Candidatus Obscuribacterales bacterium]